MRTYPRVSRGVVLAALVSISFVLSCFVAQGGQGLCVDMWPRRVGGAEPGECKMCHGPQEILPRGHVVTVDMGLTECRTCHEVRKKDLRTKIPLSHIHQLCGVACDHCHQTPGSAKPLNTGQCLACHDSREQVAQATRGLEPNPHNSPHYGVDLDCDLCHHQHARSENFCAQCHEWKLHVP